MPSTGRLTLSCGLVILLGLAFGYSASANAEEWIHDENGNIIGKRFIVVGTPVDCPIEQRCSLSMTASQARQCIVDICAVMPLPHPWSYCSPTVEIHETTGTAFWRAATTGGGSYATIGGYCSCSFGNPKGVNGVCEKIADRATQKSAGQPCNGEGNPCDVGTGNKYQTEVDFDTGSLRFERFYNSLFDTTAGHIGAHWSHSYSGYLTIDATTIEVHRPNGQLLTFDKTALTSDPDVFDSLQAEGSNWVYKTTDKRFETYNSTGELVAIRELNGLTTTLSRSNGRLDSVTDPYGRTLGFDYDADGKLKTLTFPDPAHQITYHYTGDTLSAVDYPALSGGVETRQYHYDDTNHPNALTGITDENGVRYAEWQYFGNGRAKQSKHFGGADQVDFVFNADNTVVTDALGKVRTYSFELHHDLIKPKTISDAYTERGQPKTAARSYTYTANGQIDTLTDANGRITDYDYDNRGLLIQRIEAQSTSNQRTTTIDWHPTHRVPIRRVEPGRITEYEYDSCSTGNFFHLCRTTITDDGAFPGESRTWTYTYTTSADNTVEGLIKTVDGPRAGTVDRTVYGYYDSNHPWQGLAKTITNGLNHVTTVTGYDGNGSPTSILDANQNTLALTYDPRGRLKERTIGGSTTRYDYRPDGSVQQVTRGAGDFLKYGYDGAKCYVPI